MIQCKECNCEMIDVPVWKYDELIATRDLLETVKIIVENEKFPRDTLALILGVTIKEDNG